MKTSQVLPTSNSPKKKISVIGDSTIDNQAWVSPGIIGNVIYTRLGIKRDSTEERIRKSHRKLWKTELSVIENLRDTLSDYEICDYTNDGFTTHDCLYGQVRDKVFGPGTLSMFPHENFAPLTEAKEDLQKSSHIILSIGGNNFREFLMRASRFKNDPEKIAYIRRNFDVVFERLKNEYIEIVKRVRAENKDATIILMTQYYPSFTQDTYHLYPFMQLLGKALNIGANFNDPGDVIHEIMKRTYSAALKEIPKENVIVADITSSLDPFDKHNHTSQIEPSGVGGKKISQMLSYLIKNNPPACLVYSFQPEFFTNNNNDAAIKKATLDSWLPNHPYSFKDAQCEDLLNDLLKERDKFVKGSQMYEACHRVYCDGTALLKNLNKKNDAAELQKSLQLTLHALHKPQDSDALNMLKANAKETSQKGSSLWRSFAGSLSILIGRLANYLIPATYKNNNSSQPTFGDRLIASGQMLMFNGSPKQILGNDLTTLADEVKQPTRKL